MRLNNIWHWALKSQYYYCFHVASLAGTYRYAVSHVKGLKMNPTTNHKRRRKAEPYLRILPDVRLILSIIVSIRLSPAMSDLTGSPAAPSSLYSSVIKLWRPLRVVFYDTLLRQPVNPDHLCPHSVRFSFYYTLPVFVSRIERPAWPLSTYTASHSGVFISIQLPSPHLLFQSKPNDRSESIQVDCCI